jgi:4-amino-4-deoxy-L-arabinose transferase-like glycosyltransferase
MKKIWFLIIVFAFSFLIFNLIYAAEPYKLSVPLGDIKEVTDIAGYIRSFYLTALGLAGLLAMANIVIGALLYTLSAGSIAKREDAKDRITQAIVGLILLFGAFIVLRTINPELVSLKQPTLSEFAKVTYDPYAHLKNQVEKHREQWYQQQTELTKLHQEQLQKLEEAKKKKEAWDKDPNNPKVEAQFLRAEADQQTLRASELNKELMQLQTLLKQIQAECDLIKNKSSAEFSRCSIRVNDQLALIRDKRKDLETATQVAIESVRKAKKAEAAYEKQVVTEEEAKGRLGPE